MSEKKLQDSSIDKLITALYLAQSDTREKMLAELVQNVLYSENIPLKQESILKYIKDNFHLEPIEYEINSAINNLTENNCLLYNEPYYTLTEDSKGLIHKSIVKTKEESDKRFNQFRQLVENLYAEVLDETDLNLLWLVFNEYLLECFMLFGRRAIQIFLPYNDLSISEDENIHKQACAKLSGKPLIQIFKKLVIEYPKRLSSLELRYLTTIADRAEKFYSLGIEKSDYEKISSLKIKDLVIVLDTNVLYSVLNLRYHAENGAINELIKLSISKTIDLRLVYIRRTYSELHKAKQYLERIISKESFRPTHIKAMLLSNKLDGFARQFYESKLQNNDTPHPSSKIMYGMDLLKSRSVNLYNHPFPKLDDTDATYLSSKIKDYYDFQRIHNFHKIDLNIEHDVYLREAIVELKERYSTEDELKFVCITLDNSLIFFDKYMQKKSMRKSAVVNPNFILPSVFLRRIRPFIPIVTDDYRKAFLTSVTSPSYDSDNHEQNILIQRSMTYFKNLGIEDEQIILNCIKRDLFLEEIENIRETEKAEEFILSEIGKEIEDLMKEMTDFEIQQRVSLSRREEQFEELISSKEESLETEKQNVSELRGQLFLKDEAITNLTERLTLLEKYQSDKDEQQFKLQQLLESQQKLKDWDIAKEQFLKEQWKSEIIKLRNDTFYMFKAGFIMILPIIIAILVTIFKDQLTIFFKENNISLNIVIIYIILGLAQLFELFARTYIINKDRVKVGWNWLMSNFIDSVYHRTIREYYDKYESLFKEKNPL